jgi:hypothetical protein
VFGLSSVGFYSKAIARFVPFAWQKYISKKCSTNTIRVYKVSEVAEVAELQKVAELLGY